MSNLTGRSLPVSTLELVAYTGRKRLRTDPGDANFVEIGRAMRHAHADARACGATLEQTVVLGVVLDLTASYTRWQADVPLAELAERARLHPKNAQAALAWLRRRGIIDYRAGTAGRPWRLML